ncbi:MAG: heat-shock protein Hsp70, partial [Planctomycetes bacterium RBG_16_64_10]
METILGIDLGTTNSVVAIIRDGKPEVLMDDDGQAILPSVVGLDAHGNVLVGQAARNQAILAPDRTVTSVKRRMGEDVQLPLGASAFTPQEISSLILKTLKDRAQRRLGYAVEKAVITVPAFFGENQREATREAGVLAGLEVVRIINEPTAASLTYEANQSSRETLLVYDLGGGTFDVSVVQIEDGVVEVLASHGDTRLGGDDFDRLLLDKVCAAFHQEHALDLREIVVARSRLLQAVERTKCELSFEAYASLQEEFIASKQGRPLNLETVIDRSDYEVLIEPLLKKTIDSVDRALSDAKLHAKDIDKVLLVGGATRTPLIHHLLEEQLGQQPHSELDPDLCVALGAAIQGALIAGIDVGPVLVDITPKTLGVRCLGQLHGLVTNRVFSPIIHRNTALPATRSRLYYTAVPGQEVAQIDVYQGEHEDIQLNELVGKFNLEGLNEAADMGNEILVRFELSLDGTLNVTATERATAQKKQLSIDNAITRFRASSHDQAKQKLAQLFAADTASLRTDQDAEQSTAEARKQALGPRCERGQELMAKAERLSGSATDEDANEIRTLVERLTAAITKGLPERIDELSDKLEDVL